MLDRLIERMERVKRGEKSNFVLYDHPLGRVSKLQKMIDFGSGRYIVMTGPPGTGKTSYIDIQFVLKPILSWIHGGATPPNYIYRSMERSIEDKLAKMVSAIIHIDQKKIIDPSIMLGFSNAERLVNDDDISLVKSYSDYFTVIERQLDLISGVASASEVLKYAVDKAKSRGTLFTTKDGKVLANGKVVAELKEKKVAGAIKMYADFEWGQIMEGEEVFIPYDNQVYIHVVDHIGKIGGDDKSVLDTHSNNMAYLRDVYQYGCIDISQMNRSFYSNDRGANITISMKDLKGTNVTAENADLILGIIDPYSHRLSEFAGYDVDMFVDQKKNSSRLRVLVCAKNTQGPSGFNIGLAFWGENGLTFELPSPQFCTIVDAERTIDGTFSVI